jgi:hypothetical protein
MSDTFWVLRCGITGDAFASQDERPNDWDMPVEWDFRQCFWAEEKRPTPKKEPLLPVYGTCYTCGSDTTNGICHYNSEHFT